jgi:hypothetical protein
MALINFMGPKNERRREERRMKNSILRAKMLQGMETLQKLFQICLKKI